MASRDTLFTPWLKYLIRVRAQGTLEGGGCQSETIVYLLFHGYVYIYVVVYLFPAVRAASLSSPCWGSDVSLRIL